MLFIASSLVVIYASQILSLPQISSIVNNNSAEVCICVPSGSCIGSSLPVTGGGTTVTVDVRIINVSLWHNVIIQIIRFNVK